MENLFFLLIVFVIIVSNVLSIRKRMRDRQAGAPPGSQEKEQTPQAGWRKSVEKLLEQMREEFEPLPPGKPSEHERAPKERKPPEIAEKADRGYTGRPPGWKDVKRKTERSYSMEGRESLLERQSRDKEVIKRQAAVTRKDSEAIRGDAIGIPKRKPHLMQTPAQEFSSRAGNTYSVAQLQTAVIWSEILGHPVALRKGRREPWL
jgi:hypothetical protein